MKLSSILGIITGFGIMYMFTRKNNTENQPAVVNTGNTTAVMNDNIPPKYKNNIGKVAVTLAETVYYFGVNNPIVSNANKYPANHCLGFVSNVVKGNNGQWYYAFFHNGNHSYTYVSADANLRFETVDVTKIGFGGNGCSAI